MAEAAGVGSRLEALGGAAVGATSPVAARAAASRAARRDPGTGGFAALLAGVVLPGAAWCAAADAAAAWFAWAATAAGCGATAGGTTAGEVRTGPGAVLDTELGSSWRIGADRPLTEVLSSDSFGRLGAVMAVDADGILRGVVTVDRVRRALQSAFGQPTG